MIIDSGFEVAQPVDKVWAFFDDIPRVASCLPGAFLTSSLGEDRYSGGVTIRMGPVRLAFDGTAGIVSKDDTAKKIVVQAAGADEKGRGNAAMTVTAALSSSGGGTKVDVTQDLQLSGAAAQYGRGMIADFSAIMMRDFSANMAASISGGPVLGGAAASGDAVGGSASGGAAGGFGLAVRAARLALARVFRRFFVPYQGGAPV